MHPSSSGDPESPNPDSYFAPSARATTLAVRAAATAVAQNSVVDHLLQNHKGLLAVLNAERQILAVNHQLLNLLGVDHAEQVLGLRPGEAIDCAHAHDHPGGCGTSRFCSTCGAAIAIAVCQQAGASAFRECVLDCRRGGVPSTLDLRVHATRISIAGDHFVLLYLRDVSAEKRRAAIERAFFHDVNNLLASLMGTMDLLADKVPPAHATEIDAARAMVQRLGRELDFQRALSSHQPGRLRVQPAECQVAPALRQLLEELSAHPAARHRHLECDPVADQLTIRSDPFLVGRVLTNMTLNALEATPREGKVTLGAEGTDDECIFSVWNVGHIPEGVALRIFQRYFSTKSGPGRGIGTFSMKLLAEQHLGGKVDFTTSPDEGTRFYLRLPRHFFGDGP